MERGQWLGCVCGCGWVGGTVELGGWGEGFPVPRDPGTCQGLNRPPLSQGL